LQSTVKFTSRKTGCGILGSQTTIKASSQYVLLEFKKFKQFCIRD